jgi:hypothetical protein
MTNRKHRSHGGREWTPDIAEICGNKRQQVVRRGAQCPGACESRNILVRDLSHRAIVTDGEAGLHII